MLTAEELRKKYLDFFKEKGHAVIPSASLIPPDTDPTALFITAGMQPLVPYLLGEKHPDGKRLVDIQKCIRTGDIEEVGDTTHHTFFEMLGNWSLGDYFKEDAIKMSWTFLTGKKWLNLDKNRIAVSVFAGDDDAPFDDEAFNIWKKFVISEERIAKLSKKDNWWGPAGETGPCGPDTEMFYWVGREPAPKKFNPESKLWVEIWNDVFMQYNKIKNGKYESLKQKNIDTGMGLERVLAVKNGLDDNYKTELFWPIIEKIEELSRNPLKSQSFKYNEEQWITKSFRIIADHMKAAVMILGDEKGISPSNVGAGYVLRRLIRRAIKYSMGLGVGKVHFTWEIAQVVIDMYGDIYPELKKNETFIYDQLIEEENKFLETFGKALPRSQKRIKILERIEEGKKDKEDEKWIKNDSKIANNKIFEEWTKASLQAPENIYSVSAGVAGTSAFALESTWGYPHDVFFDDLKQSNFNLIKDVQWYKSAEEEFLKAYLKHQDLSRTASAGMFKGGLADAGEQTTKYHTATHLLLAALREILGPETYQKGSNITAERLRFDFNSPQKLTPEQIKQVEDLVNKKIQEKIPVELIEMSKTEALKIAKVSFDPAKYGEVVKVYKIGDYSIELCGGPHVKNTGDLGHFKIAKEEASSAGIRRIKAILE